MNLFTLAAQRSISTFNREKAPRSGRGAEERSDFGRLSIDRHKRIACLDGTPVDLTTNEFTALDLLARHPGRVMDRDRILQELRGMDSEAFNRSVDITMSRLRHKLGDDPKSPVFIKTVWGAGYVFIGETNPDADTPHA